MSVPGPYLPNKTLPLTRGQFMVDKRNNDNCFMESRLTIQQLAMVHSHASHTANEFEVGQVVLITQARVGVDLQCVVIPAQTHK